MIEKKMKILTLTSIQIDDKIVLNFNLLWIKYIGKDLMLMAKSDNFTEWLENLLLTWT